MSNRARRYAALTGTLAPLAALLVNAAVANGGEFGTPNEAKAMLDRAIDALKADNRAAIDKFNHNDFKFRDRDLFVFCFDASTGKFTAHEAFINRDVRTLRDPTGNAYGEQIFQSGREGQIVEVAYVSPLPGTMRTVARIAYVTRFGEQVCGVSAYR